MRVIILLPELLHGINWAALPLHRTDPTTLDKAFHPTEHRGRRYLDWIWYFSPEFELNILLETLAMCGWNIGLEDVWARLRADPSCRYKYPPPWRHSTYIYKDKEFKMPFTNIRRTEIMFRPCHLLLLSKLFLSICFAMCVMSDNLVSCSNSLADWWLLRSNELHIPTSSCFFSTDATSTADAKDIRKEKHGWQAQIYFNCDFYRVGKFQQENKHFQWNYFENNQKQWMISVRPKEEEARVQKVEEICFHSWSTLLSEFHLNSRIVSKYLTCFSAYFVKKKLSQLGY